MSGIKLFKNVSAESEEAMIKCFKAETRVFRKGETIAVYSSDMEYLYILLSGRAHLYCMDSEGEYTLLEHYAGDDIFGEAFAMPYGELGFAVEADSECEVMLIRFASIYGRCPNACEHHTQVTRNLFELSAVKAQSLSARINMISQRSVRRKLCAYLEYLRDKTGGSRFDIDVSLTHLAEYLCVDRSSMMHELKAMCNEGLIEKQGKTIKLIKI